jgi:hypothetical protein
LTTGLLNQDWTNCRVNIEEESLERSDVVRVSKIDGEFEGFDDEVLFKLIDGTAWVQAEYKYWYHYAYCPNAVIFKKNGRFFIQVDGKDQIVPVRQVSGLIESQVAGEFKGWEGESKYQLVNGQVWEQAEYKYEYKYAYMPQVCIYDGGSGYVMRVEGTYAKVRRIR